MKPELNREYPELDDPTVFAQMVELTLAQMKPIEGRLRRGQHARATGCATAQFQIADDVPSDLRHGVFGQPGRTFNAIVRFSNSQGTFEKDGSGTARGLAIKLLEVGGTRAVPGDSDSTQDFVMIDHPVFPFPNPKAYLDTISRKNIPLTVDLQVGHGPAGAEGAQDSRPSEPATCGPARSSIGAARRSGSVRRRDWGHAVEYSAVSRQANRAASGSPRRPTRRLSRAGAPPASGDRTTL